MGVQIVFIYYRLVVKINIKYKALLNIKDFKTKKIVIKVLS